jgi:hypothetical protein
MCKWHPTLFPLKNFHHILLIYRIIKAIEAQEDWEKLPAILTGIFSKINYVQEILETSVSIAFPWVKKPQISWET